MTQRNEKPDIKTLLAMARADTPRKRRLRWGGAAALVTGVALYLLFGSGGEPALRYKSVEAKRGPLVVTVTSTGTLQPLNQVEVGSELSGTIARVEVDFNQQVKAGQVLARLDTDILKAKLVEAQASLRSAQARKAEAGATVTETRLNLARCQELLVQQMCSKSDHDKLQADHERARANESMAKAQVAMAQAAVDVQQTNLRKAVIRSPINGVVLDRKVEPGQTVAASFQTPVLFTIAEDLKRMELRVAVDEADIGQVRLNQTATFSVDAFPRRSFDASVMQIRQAPKTVEGVVTYETVLLLDNSDQALLPGMTATAQIVVNKIDDALLVPNAALRFKPPSGKRKSSGFSFFPQQRPPGEGRPEKGRGNNKPQLWIEQEGKLKSYEVNVGASDGQWTQLLAGEVKAGDAIVVDAVSSAK